MSETIAPPTLPQLEQSCDDLIDYVMDKERLIKGHVVARDDFDGNELGALFYIRSEIQAAQWDATQPERIAT